MLKKNNISRTLNITGGYTDVGYYTVILTNNFMFNLWHAINSFALFMTYISDILGTQLYLIYICTAL